MTAPSSDVLHQLLKKHFGYDSFRPLQEEIVHTTLSGRDVLALLPTGGGKSLCFQLPALVGKGLTLVVSPLIALMKDQVDQLLAAGIPATFLNSTLDADEARHRLGGLNHGEYRLLYAAPERVMLPGFMEDLKRWKVERIAIDEAHCISEWGHDFRPEYRQLPALRRVLPDVPIIALTATATDQVRDDIGQYLELNDPVRFTASFNRPNLTYRVAAKSNAYAQALSYLREHPDDSGIIYCQSRKTTEQLAERLQADGIPAVAYHAGLDHRQRSLNQEAYLRDRVRVVCATIAFGMGINKPNVRFVVHYDLPKNLEGYYQETGRAGRDGLPGECLLLFSGGDVAKYLNFITENPDPADAARQRHLLNQVVHYAESSECRRRTLLDYFSEIYPEKNCGSCDNCLSPKESFDGTLAAQKLLSCVVRANQASRWQFGLGQYCDILCGANTESIRKWDQFKLSTYGIGKEMSKAQWQLIGRELVRLGLLEQDAARMGSIAITASGMTALKNRVSITLTRPLATTKAAKTPSASGQIECDEALFQLLRGTRKELADARGVPPYVIFGDVTLRHMARRYPVTDAAFRELPGVGEQKLRDFGAAFTSVVQQYLKTNEPKPFEQEAKPASPPSPPPVAKPTSTNGTAAEPLRLFLQHRSISQVAGIRQLAESTITSHLCQAIASGQAKELSAAEFLSEAEIAEIDAIFTAAGLTEKLSVVRELCAEKFSYAQLHLFRAFREAGKI